MTSIRARLLLWILATLAFGAVASDGEILRPVRVFNL